MKKTLKTLTAVLVLATLCLGLLAGCAGTSIIGRWEATAAKMGDSELDLAAMESYGLTETMELEFKEDGTVIAYTNGEASAATPYTDNGNGSVTIAGQQLTIEGGRLYMRYAGMDMALIFTKK